MSVEITSELFSRAALDDVYNIFFVHLESMENVYILLIKKKVVDLKHK